MNINKKRGLIGLIAGTIISGFSLFGIGKCQAQKYDYVSSEDRKILTLGSFDNPNAISPFKEYSKIPRMPAVSDNWWSFVQDVYADTNSELQSGDIWVIYQGPKTEHQGKKIRITEHRRANSPDLYENKLVYHASESIPYPHWPAHIYYVDLTKINLDALVDLGGGLWAPSEPRKNYEICLTERIRDPENKGHIDPKINGNHIVWRTGYYRPELKEPNGFNYWPQIWMHDLDEEQSFPISSGKRHWKPSIDGDWIGYAVHEGFYDDPSTEKIENYGSWNVYGYHIPTQQEFIVCHDHGVEKRSVAVYDDTKESGEAIFVYEYGYSQGENNGLGITRARIKGDKIILDDNENYYNLPKNYITGNMCDCIDIFGLAGTKSEPGVGPFAVFGDYSGLNYNNAIKITAVNLRDMTLINVASHSRWLYSPRGWVYRDTKKAVVVYRDDIYSAPQIYEALSDFHGNSINQFNLLGMVAKMDFESFNEAFQTKEEVQPKISALVVDTIKDRPVPKFCRDEGTVYLPGDSNKDCRVGLEDLDIFLQNWLNNLGKSTDPQDPNKIHINPPEIIPDITITSEINPYFYYSQEEFLMREDYSPPIAQKKIYHYCVRNSTFGNLEIKSIKIPLAGVYTTYLDYENKEKYTFFEEDIVKDWKVSFEKGVVWYEDNPENYIYPGKEGHFFIISSANENLEKKMTVYTNMGALEFSVQVPRENILGESDINRDGIVDKLDLFEMSNNWMNSGKGDFNNDGKVNFNDFVELAERWQNTEAWYINP